MPVLGCAASTLMVSYGYPYLLFRCSTTLDGYFDRFFGIPLVELAMPWLCRVPRKNVVFGYGVAVCLHG